MTDVSCSLGFPQYILHPRSVLFNYLGPDRHYHDLFHAASMLHGRREFYPDVKDAEEVDYGILYHDAEYNPLASTNEAESADAAVRELEEVLPAPRLMNVHRLIMLTKDHLPEPGDEQGAVIVDLDLAGLAGKNYFDNSRAIRKEFHMVSDQQWREGRVAWLEKFLDRQDIYHTPHGRMHWELKARSNMWEELEYLQDILAEKSE